MYKLNTYFKDTVQKKQKMKTNTTYRAQTKYNRTIYQLTTNWYDNQIGYLNKAMVINFTNFHLRLVKQCKKYYVENLRPIKT